MPKKEVLLSISKKSRKLGVAVLSGNSVIYYDQRGLVTKRNSAAKTAAEIADSLIETYKPKYLVMDRIAFKQQHIESFIKVRRIILDVAERHRLAVREYSLSEARASICSGIKPTKANIAQSLVSQYPEFKRFRPKESGWQIDHYQPLFNALTLGFHFVNTTSKTS